MMGCTIKLVGNAALSDSKDELTVFVSPVMVPLGGPLASARGPGNVVVVRSENLSECPRNLPFICPTGIIIDHFHWSVPCVSPKSLTTNGTDLMNPY